jgi:hypothetical protein
MEGGSIWRLNGGDEGCSNSNKEEASSDLHRLSFFALVMQRLPVSFPRPLSRIEPCKICSSLQQHSDYILDDCRRNSSGGFHVFSTASLSTSTELHY